MLVDDPCYFNFQALLRAHRAKVIGVPYAPSGPDIERCAKLLAEHRPRLYITNAGIHNPTGAILSPVVAHRMLADDSPLPLLKTTFSQISSTLRRPARGVRRAGPRHPHRQLFQDTVVLGTLRIRGDAAGALISKGSIIIDGEDVLAMPLDKLARWRWSKVSMVFQSAMNSLNPVLTIFEQFRDVIVRHTGVSRRQARARAEELLGLVGIPVNRLDDYPHQLSGGMRQRVVLAISLALEPKLIIMDEPTTALDVVVQREILQEIMALKDKFGFSILFITHDLALMGQFADRIAVMLEGRLVEVAPADEIVTDPKHDYTRRLWSSMPVLKRTLVTAQ